MNRWHRDHATDMFLSCQGRTRADSLAWQYSPALGKCLVCCRLVFKKLPIHFFTSPFGQSEGRLEDRSLKGTSTGLSNTWDRDKTKSSFPMWMTIVSQQKDTRLICRRHWVNCARPIGEEKTFSAEILLVRYMEGCGIYQKLRKNLRDAPVPHNYPYVEPLPPPPRKREQQWI